MNLNGGIPLIKELQLLAGHKVNHDSSWHETLPAKPQEVGQARVPRKTVSTGSFDASGSLFTSTTDLESLDTDASFDCRESTVMLEWLWRCQPLLIAFDPRELLKLSSLFVGEVDVLLCDAC